MKEELNATIRPFWWYFLSIYVLCSRYCQIKLLHLLPKVNLKQAGVMTYPHFDDKWLCFLCFSEYCFDLELVRDVCVELTSIWICKLPISPNKLGYQSLTVEKRKTLIKWTTVLCNVTISCHVTSACFISLGVENVTTSCCKYRHNRGIKTVFTSMMAICSPLIF